MDDFIEEIKEDVRRDQLLSIWRQYGNYIIGIVLVILISTLGYLFWKHRVEQRLYNETIQFEKALQLSEGNDATAAEEALKNLIENASQGYKILAQLEFANLKFSQGESADEVYKAMIADKSLLNVYRQLAAYLHMITKFEGTNAQEFIGELEPLLKEKSPWVPSLLELKALALLKIEQIQEARSIFEQLLQNQDTPQALKLRAHAMVEQLQ